MATQFNPINTQEEWEAAIAPLKEKAAKYDELAAKKLDKQVETLQQQLTAANDTISGKEQTIAELTARVEAAEGAVLRAKVAHANNLPYEMAERLKGATEEELTADAQTLAKLVAPPVVAPLASTEPGSLSLSGADAAYLQMASALGGN
ncbi:MAG: hypothetical protein IJK52_01680 [Oscillospiraceae bacterium]|nr:hypothetical protein [Oscillospiraceae bacterium]